MHSCLNVHSYCDIRVIACPPGIHRSCGGYKLVLVQPNCIESSLYVLFMVVLAAMTLKSSFQSLLGPMSRTGIVAVVRSYVSYRDSGRC